MTLIWNITYQELDTSWKGHGSVESWKEEQKKLETGSWKTNDITTTRSCIKTRLRIS